MMTQPITEQMQVMDLLNHHPRTRGVFQKYGITVEGYKALEHETLAATARSHGWDLPTVLAELNAAVNEASSNA